MRIVILSDTHGLHKKMVHPIPDGDVLIHPGDCLMYGKIHELVEFNEWIGSFPHDIKILIAGNHDFCFEEMASLCRRTLTNAIYLENEGLSHGGLLFWGSPCQPEFLNWAFNSTPEQLLRYWKMIPKNTDVLITHCPPRGILDKAVRETINFSNNRSNVWESVGCEVLRPFVDDLPIKLNVFGHIHSSYGVEVVAGKTFVNAAICDENYTPCRKPIVVDWDGENMKVEEWVNV